MTKSSKNNQEPESKENTADQSIQRPKALELLCLLDDNEYISLKEGLVTNKKLRLLILLESLWSIRNGTYPANIRNGLFEQLFSEPYSKKKNYLLRNEYRHLTKQIENLLVQNEVQEELDKDPGVFSFYLLRALQDRNSLKLFDIEYQDAYESALINSDYYMAHDISRLNFVKYSQYLELKEKDIDEVNRMNDLSLMHLSCNYIAAYRSIQIDQRIIDSSFNPFSLAVDSLDKEVQVNFSEYENDYSTYYYQKAKSLTTAGAERIKILEKCLTFIMGQPIESTLYKEELKFCLSNLANSHVSLKNFEEGYDYFNKYFELKSEQHDPELLSVMCDHIAALLQGKEFTMVMEIIEDRREMLSSIEKGHTRVLCLEIGTRAFLGDHEALQNLIPKSFKGYNGRSKTFFKFYYSILAHLRGDIDSSYREVLNMKNTKTISADPELQVILKFFIRYFYNQLNAESVELKKAQANERLRSDIEEHRSSAMPSVKSYMPYLWLVNKLAN